MKRVQIRKVARLGTGHTPSRSVDAYWDPSECTIPWLTLADVWQLRDGSVSVVHDTKEKISPLGLANSAAVRHPAGTVAFSRTASVGFSCILGVDMATSQDFVTWTCGPQLDPRYLLWVLRGEREDILRRTQGSTHKTIYMPDIEQLTIPLPPLDEQRRIVRYLDRETARIDEVLGRRVHQLRRLDERETRRLSVTLGLAVIARGDGLAPTGAARTRALRWAARIRGGLTLGKRYDGPLTHRPYLRVANVQDGYLDLGDVAEVEVPAVDARRFKLEQGDVLVLEGNGNPDNLGRGCMWRGEVSDCLHQNHVHVVRPDRSLLLPEFFALALRTEWVRHWFTGGVAQVSIATLSQSRLGDLPLPLPDLSEQTRMVEQSESRRAKYERLRASLERQVALLREHRHALITCSVAPPREDEAA